MGEYGLTLSSSYADLVLEPVEGGGVLLFVRQHTGGTDGESLINLSAEQATELRQWLSSHQVIGFLRSSENGQ